MGVDILSKVGDYRRGNHDQHNNDMPAHVGQDEVELVRKTAKNVLGYLTNYHAPIHK